MNFKFFFPASYIANSNEAPQLESLWGGGDAFILWNRHNSPECYYYHCIIMCLVWVGITCPPPLAVNWMKRKCFVRLLQQPKRTLWGQYIMTAVVMLRPHQCTTTPWIMASVFQSDCCICQRYILDWSSSSSGGDAASKWGPLRVSHFHNLGRRAPYVRGRSRAAGTRKPKCMEDELNWFGNNLIKMKRKNSKSSAANK